MLTVIHPDEQFKKVYKHYLISNYGRVYSLRHDKFMQPMKNNKGYWRFESQETINGQRQRKIIFIHIAVVEAFGDRLGQTFSHHLEKDQIDHIDRDKRNNHVQNLELVTGLENMRRRFAFCRAAAEATIENTPEADCLPF